MQERQARSFHRRPYGLPFVQLPGANRYTSILPLSGCVHCACEELKRGEDRCSHNQRATTEQQRATAQTDCTAASLHAA